MRCLDLYERQRRVFESLSNFPLALKTLVINYLPNEIVGSHTLKRSFPKKDVLLVYDNNVYYKKNSYLHINERKTKIEMEESFTHMVPMTGYVMAMWGKFDIWVVDLESEKRVLRDNGSHACVANGVLYYISVYTKSV